uniref:Polycystin cation channel PKD1/PKD2 domain-containing protein n=1 Tax=Alexandrium catenella TaxID=2925 RepID=A0A7S1M1G8_ALECA
MLQERTPLVACPHRVEEFQGSIFSGRCVEQMDYWLKPELHRGLYIDQRLVNQPGGETVHLLSRRSQTVTRQVLKGLEDRAWFSPQTAKIELLFTTYNTNEDLLTATYIMFFLNRGGHIHKIVEPVSFNLDPYHGGYICYVWDICWASLIVKLFLEESWEIIKHLRQLGVRKGLMVYMNMSNGVDWVSIGVAVFLVIMWVQHLSRLQELKDILLAASPTMPGSYSTAAERNAFFDMVDGIVYDVHFLRTALALYPFVIVSRFFKAFSLQPRLAMVTMTLSKAATDITHFLVVFTTVFVIFGFSAMILWGQELEEFANEMRSLQSLFRILLGDFDWDSLHSIGRPQAYLWFWAFVWIVNMVMLNMLLAIIMDVYTDVKSGIGANAETLWSQSIEIWRRWRSVSSGRTVSLTKILSILDPTDLESDDEAEDEEVLFPSNFAERVPKMSDDQAFIILKAAYELKIAQEHGGDTLTDAMSRISRIDQRTSIMAEHISRFIQAQPVHHGLRRGGSGSITV